MSLKIGLGHIAQNTYAYNNPYARKYNNAYKDVEKAIHNLEKYTESCDDKNNKIYKTLERELSNCENKLSRYMNLAEKENKQIAEMHKQNQSGNTLDYFA